MKPRLLLTSIALITLPVYVFTNPTTKCSTPSTKKFNSLPGKGYCSLRDIELNPVFAITYDHCQQIENYEGVWLIPDNLVVTAKSTSDVQTFSEIIDHYRNYSDVTSTSMGASVTASYEKVSIGSSFSVEYKHMKKSQIKDHAVTTRSTARYHLYSARVDEYSTELHPNLKSKLDQAMEALKVGNVTRASLILELLILTHGTHVISSIDLGGLLVKEDYIAEAYRSEHALDEHVISLSASIGFADIFKAETFAKDSHSSKDYDEYQDNVKSSRVHSYGGVLFKPGLNISSWVESLSSNLVTIDKSGLPLPYLVTPRHFPNADQAILSQLRREWQQAIDHYNRVNLRAGCLNPNAKNFDFNANFGDKSCRSPSTNFTFGGVYQSCSCIGSNNGHDDDDDDDKATDDGVIDDCLLCSNYTVNNLLTGLPSCPHNFVPVFLNSRQFSHSTHKCSGWWIFKTCHSPFTNFEYKTYWCAPAGHAIIPNNTGQMFGGVFTSTGNNPLTGGRSCPQYFQHVKVLQDLTVCVSSDYELGYRYSVPFGGFFSCNQGNPLAKYVPDGKPVPPLEHAVKGCADGFSQHPATVDYDCLVNFCVKANSFGAGLREIPINLPPFQNYDVLFAEQPFRPLKQGKLEGGSIAAIVLGVLLSFVLFIIVIVMFVVPKYKKYKVVRGGSREGERLLSEPDSVPVAAYQVVLSDEEAGL